MAEYKVAPEVVVKLVEEVLHFHHEDLEDARIGVLMRDLAPKKGSHIVLGKARKLSEEERVFIPYDFLIWFSEDQWLGLTPFQQRALVDHELCHCQIDGEGSFTIKPHDIEEFHEIIERYGFWRPSSGQATEKAVQHRFAFDPELAKVEAVQKDILDQAGDLLDGKGKGREES